MFGERVLTVTGPSGSQSTIVSVGDDFEVDVTNTRANKFFSVGGVRIASLATSYTAPAASLPPALWKAWRTLEPLVPGALALVTLLGLLGLASLVLREHTPVWLSAPGVGVLSLLLISLPQRAFAATLTSGPGKYGRHAEPFLAYLPDHLGTVRAVVNRDGIVVETRDYAPFGETIAKAGTFAVEHRFTGQPQDDPAGGLYDYGARFYSAKWGRFASPDELVQGFDSQGLNPFAYVLNAPTSRVDPTGNFLFIPPIALGILIVGGFLGLGISYQIGQDLAREHMNASKAYPDGSSQSMAKWPHFKGTPGSTEEGRNEDGEVTQVRRYGPDGYPETDVDYTHDHGGGKPHAHDWGRPEGGGKPTDADRGEGRPIEKGDPGFE